MDHPALLRAAAAPWPSLLTDLTPERLTAPTPCTEFDVRALLGHLLTWGPALEAAARKEATGPADPRDGDLATAQHDQVERIAAAWSDPAAWAGSTTMGGPDPLPAAMIGGMVVAELVVHAWDLGRALGRDVTWDPALLEFVHDDVAATAQMGRDMGIYADQVPVPDGAPLLDRILGLTGRDPGLG